MTAEETATLLGRIDTKIDMLLTNSVDHETRIRGLEQSRWRWVGGSAVLAVLAAKLGVLWPVK